MGRWACTNYIHSGTRKEASHKCPVQILDFSCMIAVPGDIKLMLRNTFKGLLTASVCVGIDPNKGNSPTRDILIILPT